MTVKQVVAEGGSEKVRRAMPVPYFVGLSLAMLAYGTLLHVSYQYVIAPSNSYQNFEYRDPDLLGYVLAASVVMLVAFALPHRLTHVSDMVIWILFVGAGAPTILMGQYIDVVPMDDASVLGLNVGACLLILRFLSRVRPRMHLDRAVSELRQHLVVLILVFGVSVFAYLYLTGSLSFNFVSVYDVYDVRERFNTRQGRGIFRYLLPIQFYVLGPLMIAIGLFRRRHGLTFIGIASQAVLYATVGQKTILISIFGVLGLWLLLGRERTGSGRRLLMGFTAASWAVMLVDAIRGGEELTDLLIRRFMVVPAVLGQAYVLIFKDAPKTNFSDVVPFVHNSYDLLPSYQVGQVFFGSSTVNADASLWIHGYASYGYLGMYLETLVLVVLLWVADDVTKDLPLFLSCALFLMPGIAMGEASVFTAFLTHGFLAAIVVAALIPRTYSVLGAKYHDRLKS